MSPTYRQMGHVEFWNDWKPWIAFVIVGLFFLGGWSTALNDSTLKKDAVRRSEVKRCLASRPILHKFSEHVKGVNEVTQTLIKNSRAIVAQTKRTDPQYRVRVANLHRLETASRKVAALPGFPVPTVAHCQRTGV